MDIVNVLIHQLELHMLINLTHTTTDGRVFGVSVDAERIIMIEDWIDGGFVRGSIIHLAEMDTAQTPARRVVNEMRTYILEMMNPPSVLDQINKIEHEEYVARMTAEGRTAVYGEPVASQPAPGTGPGYTEPAVPEPGLPEPDPKVLAAKEKKAADKRAGRSSGDE